MSLWAWSPAEAADLQSGPTEVLATASGTLPGWSGAATGLVDHAATATTSLPGWSGTATATVTDLAAATATATFTGAATATVTDEPHKIKLGAAIPPRCRRVPISTRCRSISA